MDAGGSSVVVAGSRENGKAGLDPARDGQTGGDSTTQNTKSSDISGSTQGDRTGSDTTQKGAPAAPEGDISVIVFTTTFTTQVQTTIGFAITTVPVVVTSMITTTVTSLDRGNPNIGSSSQPDNNNHSQSSTATSSSRLSSVSGTDSLATGDSGASNPIQSGSTQNNLINTSLNTNPSDGNSSPTVTASDSFSGTVTNTAGTSTASAASSNNSGVCQSTCSAVASGAPIPQPCAEVDLLQVGPDDAPYDLSLSDLLASLAFPNGFQCRKNLVILMPPTAVPVTDAYAGSFIPLFANVSVANADVVTVTIPSISLGDTQVTSEYAAFAMNYAALVLNRRATQIAFSQGNINTQWALKYWPSTRQNLRNYVALSGDFDGTIEANFLCNPSSLVSSKAGQVFQQLLADNGATGLQAILCISAIPNSPGTFRLYLLQLLSGQPVNYSSSSTSSAISLPSTSLPTSLPGIPPIQSNSSSISGTVASVSMLAISSPPLVKRAIDFGEADANMKINEHLSKRQQPTTLDILVRSLQGPIQQALLTLATMPNSVLAQVIASKGNLQTLTLSTIPQGCLPALWQQQYFSNFVTALQRDYGRGVGESAFVPSTSIFSIFDEAVQPQGATGFEQASAYLTGANASNILIQANGGFLLAPSVLIAGLPSVVTHEGILYNGLAVEAAIIAVQTGGKVAVEDVPAAVRCELLSPRLTVAQALQVEAISPGAVLRGTIGDEGMAGSSSFVAQEPPLRAYATRRFT